MKATFPAATLAVIRPGQNAYIQADTTSDTFAPKPLPAIIMDVSSRAKDGQIEVILEAIQNNAGYSGSGYNGVEGLHALKDTIVWVTVAVDQISPAALVLRTSGKLIRTPPISINSRG
ncbi:MAG: hypothetical protein AAF702_12160 [Chloroflexota bacterium]